MIENSENDIDIDIDWELRRFPEAFWDVSVQPINADLTEAGVYNITLEDRKELLKDILTSQTAENAEHTLIMRASTGEKDKPVKENVPVDAPATENEIAYAGAQLRVAIVALRLIKQDKPGNVERTTLQEAINTLESQYTKLMRGEM